MPLSLFCLSAVDDVSSDLCSTYWAHDHLHCDGIKGSVTLEASKSESGRSDVPQSSGILRLTLGPSSPKIPRISGVSQGIVIPACWAPLMKRSDTAALSSTKELFPSYICSLISGVCQGKVHTAKSSASNWVWGQTSRSGLPRIAGSASRCFVTTRQKNTTADIREIMGHHMRIAIHMFYMRLNISGNSVWKFLPLQTQTSEACRLLISIHGATPKTPRQVECTPNKKKVSWICNCSFIVNWHVLNTRSLKTWSQRSNP